MPTYCYRDLDDDSADIQEITMTMSEKDRREDVDGVLIVGGRRMQVHMGVQCTQIKRNKAEWPIWSYAAGCHPSQISEFRAHLKKSGCDARIGSDGAVEMRNRGHRKAVCKAFRMIDRDGGYGDA